MRADVSKPSLGDKSVEVLFEPFTLRTLRLPNRIVMPAMARCFAEDGVPMPVYRDYFRRRAEGGVGLLIGEATAIDHPVACQTSMHTRIDGPEHIAAWRAIVEEVHSVGGLFMPQLWHCGLLRGPGKEGAMPNPSLAPVGPSGWAIPLVQPEGLPGNPIFEPVQLNTPMTQRDIDDVIAAFGKAARVARDIGADGVEIHGAHGYLIDQFFWDKMNFRDDGYGGDLAARTRFAAEVIAECRRQVGPDFPISMRFSQWKQQDYGVKLAQTPRELETVLRPLADAGVDLFDCSTRRFWEPEFAGSDLTLAGWTKKLSGKASMAVGSVGLQKANWASNTGFQLEESGTASLDNLLERMERREFDLFGIGRTLIANPSWPRLIRAGAYDDIRPYRNELLMTLE